MCYYYAFCLPSINLNFSSIQPKKVIGNSFEILKGENYKIVV